MALTSLLAMAHSPSGAARDKIIDLLPDDIFESRAPAQLSDYPNEQAAMQYALARYLEPDYEVVDCHLHLSGAFGLVIKNRLHDFFVENLHAKKVSSRFPIGLSSVTIWKVGGEYAAIVVAELIPGDMAIYGYYELRRK